MSELTSTQVANINRLLSRLRVLPFGCAFHVGLTNRNGLLKFIMDDVDRNVVGFITAYGGCDVMTWNGAAVTNNNTNRIASYVNSVYGGKFYQDVLLAGDQMGNYGVNVREDIIPCIEAFKAKYDRAGVIRLIERELAQVRQLIGIANAPVSVQVGNLISKTQKQRWLAMERKLVADLVEARAF